MLKNGLFPTAISWRPLVWATALLLLLAVVDRPLHQFSTFLVPPFAATLSILLYLPQQPVAQPLPVIIGSTLTSALGTGLALFLHGPIAAVAVAAGLLWLLPRVGLYHPPAIALAMYPLLLKPGPWFPIAVVLPSTLVAVLSHLFLSRRVPDWPLYPRKTPEDAASAE